MNIAIIPARGQSRRIPRKNIRPFFGRPIIEYSIATAKQSGLFRQVWVSTDDDEIAAVAKAQGCAVIKREAHLARDEVGTLEVTREAFMYIRTRYDERIELVCCVYATAPLLETSDLYAGREAMLKHHVPHAFAVGTRPLRDAGLFYWSHPVALEFNVPLYRVAALIEIEESRVCDINEEADWGRAEVMYRVRENMKVLSNL